jgi:hypothetical protein
MALILKSYTTLLSPGKKAKPGTETPLSLGSLGNGTNFKMDPGLLLERVDDAQQIFGGGISVWTKHPHQALLRTTEHLAEPLKADRRVDIDA